MAVKYFDWDDAKLRTERSIGFAGGSRT